MPRVPGRGVELDAVAGVDDDPALVGRHGREGLGERLARQARNRAGVEDDGHDGRLARRTGPGIAAARAAELGRHRTGSSARSAHGAWRHGLLVALEGRVQEAVDRLGGGPEQGGSAGRVELAAPRDGGHLLDEGATELEEGRDDLAHRRAEGPGDPAVVARRRDPGGQRGEPLALPGLLDGGDQRCRDGAAVVAQARARRLGHRAEPGRRGRGASRVEPVARRDPLGRLAEPGEVRTRRPCPGKSRRDRRSREATVAARRGEGDDVAGLGPAAERRRGDAEHRAGLADGDPVRRGGATGRSALGHRPSSGRPQRSNLSNSLISPSRSPAERPPMVGERPASLVATDPSVA